MTMRRGRGRGGYRCRGRGRRGRRRGGRGRRHQSPVKRGAIIVLRPCIQLAFEPWPAYPSRYPFAFRHPARGGSMSSTGLPPFAFSRATATPQSKSTSTRESHETRSTGNVETTTTSSSPSGGSPTSAVSPTSSVPSPQDVRGMPMPPRHPAAAGGRQRPRQHQVLFLLHQRAVLRLRGHDKRSRGTVGSCVIALARKSYRSLTARTNAHPARDSLHLSGSLEAREREDSVGLLSPAFISAKS
jgi:hypothetical protein